MRPEVLDLNEVVGDLRKLLRRAIPESVDLRLETGSVPITITADPTQIEQVVMNLCINSRDAMPDGGSLHVGTGIEAVDAGDSDRRPGLEPGTYATLWVRDTGFGIDEQTMRHVFEPFFTTKPRGEGTGLGLATVYGIVKRLEGFVYVDSEVGEGTTVQILLPMHSSGREDAEVASSEDDLLSA